MFQLLNRCLIGNDGNRFSSFGVLFFIVASCVVGLAILTITSGRISNFTIIFRMRPITCVNSISMCERTFSFRSVLSSGQGRLFERIVEAMIIKTTTSDCERFVNITMDRRGRINANL